MTINGYIIDAVKNGINDRILHYTEVSEAACAVPTQKHYLPVINCPGTADGEAARNI